MVTQNKERRRVVLKNQEMDILGEVRVIPEINVDVDCHGKVCMSFDEYNRISDWIHSELKRRRKVRYK